MKNLKIVILTGCLALAMIIASAFTQNKVGNDTQLVHNSKGNEKQKINLFVTHGHCSTPFSGTVNDLKIETMVRLDQGNPLENMKISFNIDPGTFNVCASDELSKRLRKPGLFTSDENESIRFETTSVYTMGIDWYQVNGRLSIKGIEKEVKLFATGIRETDKSLSSDLVLQGQIDLMEWGIDYDKIMNGKSDPVPTKWLYLNMSIDLNQSGVGG